MEKPDYYLPGINTLASQIRDCCQRHGFEAVDESNTSQRLCLIHDEISEAHEEVRSGKPHFYLQPVGAVRGSDPVDGDAPLKPEGLGPELADAVIRILDMAESLDIDIARMISLKMKYNETRPMKHGRKF